MTLGSIYFINRARQKSPIYPIVEVTIPEGYTARQIDEKLFTEGIIKKRGEVADFDISRFRNSYRFLKDAQGVEGFLFPDTYDFYLGSSPEVVVEKFLKNFKDKTEILFTDKTNVYRIVILASIIEKEVPDLEYDRQIVSGIILKREKAGIPLQVDASLCYAKNQLGCGGVKSEDKKIDSPYNTYLNKGLTPGPIGNPGLLAIKAAFSPKESEYWYYISDPKTGKTIFAKSLEDHNGNIFKYLR